MLNELKRETLRKPIYVGYFLLASFHLANLIRKFFFDTIITYKYPTVFILIGIFVFVIPAFTIAYGNYKKTIWSLPATIIISFLIFLLQINLVDYDKIDTFSLFITILNYILVTYSIIVCFYLLTRNYFASKN
ncbi:hypothetical protein A2191_03160 [Candidatus Woesebacteria bacterium RIFOXYA1_FULL_38_9]|nr:MAG: hypothetical protein A2191_03160 [Candidatus Woesebacteria bacterium RIFOXYA1_FULL_38_9]